MDSLRVISGSKKGHKLKAPKGKNTRPTEGRIKEALFNILGYIPEDSIVLDLFAGSGAIGIEFLSRGAKCAYFIDRSYLSIKIINDNLEHTNLSNKSKVIKNDAFRGVKSIGERKIKFNYIFIDPPYGEDLILKSVEALDREDILEENGIIIIEHEENLKLNDNISNFRKKDSRKYGSKALSFYIK